MGGSFEFPLCSKIGEYTILEMLNLTLFPSENIPLQKNIPLNPPLKDVISDPLIIQNMYQKLLKLFDSRLD